MDSLSFCQQAGQNLGPLDVFVLRALVSAAEQNNHNLAALDVIDPLARPKVDLHFNDTGANAARISWVSVLKPVDPRQNLRSTLPVSQIAQPRSEFFGATDLHVPNRSQSR
jgi:hypothetical protein